jgi:hypothetical protein
MILKAFQQVDGVSLRQQPDVAGDDRGRRAIL